MDQVYSLTLLVALAIGSLGTASGGLACFGLPRKKATTARLALGSVCCGLLALIFGGWSVVIHLRHGHGAQAAEPMTTGDFFLHHKAYWFVVALAAASIIGGMVARYRKANQTRA